MLRKRHLTLRGAELHRIWLTERVRKRVAFSNNPQRTPGLLEERNQPTPT